MKIPIQHIPDDIIEQYNRKPLIHDGCFYILRLRGECMVLNKLHGLPSNSSENNWNHMDIFQIKIIQECGFIPLVAHSFASVSTILVLNTTHRKMLIILSTFLKKIIKYLATGKGKTTSASL